ncbi:response regulator [Candidatus Nitronereus thalassa]|uniref:Response regulator n=1 Tax=Candidatus Nitronereus thalassa TaxID=3020898 RepID=A0ABU3K983_9BACT|nr:response regulator [Candidatus Nitronereus thalassa]MDT7042972.1 response regulator [Candidatus Nitronereus thalassa]
MATILLIEDNELNRDMLSRRLSSKGFHVLVAEDGKKGLEMTQTEQPDLVLMDMNLPEIDGWNATKTMKHGEDTKHIPVIALTSHAMTGDKERAYEAGCDEYEPKPIDFSSLLIKIHRLLPEPSV